MALTVDTLVSGYVAVATAVTKLDAGKKYEWAGKLSTLLDSLADDKARTSTSIEIGKAIAEGIGRPQAYSGSWVRNHANAYRAFPDGLQSVEDCKSFMEIVNGNQKKTPPPPQVDPETGEEIPAEEKTRKPKGYTLAQLDATVLGCLNVGIAWDDIVATVNKYRPSGGMGVDEAD